MRSHGLTDDDRAFLRWLGKDESSVIAYPQSMLVINDVESEVSRVELKIAADAFVLTVVGNRLDLELDPAFLQMLQNTLTDKIHILFIGDFDYEEKLADYPRLKEQSQSLGFRDDLLSVLKIADCFVNPRRSGGGTGGKMALVAGIPVVTLPQCDVANSAGEDFLVRDYDEMQAVITRLASDGEYYRRQAANAKKRAAALQNVGDTIKYFIAEVLRREREK